MKTYQQKIRGEFTPDRNKLKRVESKLFEVKLEFLELFESRHREYISRHTYFAGGCIYSLYNNKPVNDYDVFCDDLEAVNFICKNISESIVVFETKNAVTIKEKTHDLDFQIIKKYYGEPDEVVGQFDFYHNHFAFIGGKVISFYNWRYLETTKLCFNATRARDVANVILRIPKFIKKGFTLYKSDHAEILLKVLQNAEQEIESLKSGTTGY